MGKMIHRRELCWPYMLSMLVEGMEEVRDLREHLKSIVMGRMSLRAWRYRHGFTEVVLEVQLEHAYHHLNWVWGCRRSPLERAVRCSSRDFRNWERFPLAFRTLFPSSHRRAIQLSSRAILHPKSILLGLNEALLIGDEIQLGLLAHLNEKTCPQFIKWDSKAVTIMPLTESQLARQLQSLLGALNFAWNVRRLLFECIQLFAEWAVQHWRCYPAEFSSFLTKRHICAGAKG